jgi:GMP synthase-like glutamine amidotransferase
MKRGLGAFLVILCLGAYVFPLEAAAPLTAPKLNNNPTWDIIATNRRPLLTFYNASGGSGKRTYTIQIDKAPTFDSQSLVEYKKLPETDQYITSKLVEQKDALADKSRYFWRVRAVDAKGSQGPWAQSRFYLDSTSDDAFMGLVRVPVQKVEVSSGGDLKNITDLSDPGQATYWRATPPGEPNPWITFDLGKTWKVARIWMLSNRVSPDGWLTNFVWQKSKDGKAWEDIPGASIDNNDTYRNIIEFKPVEARYFRLFIKAWSGYAPQINAITLYSPGKPPVPRTPEKDYVLLIGNQQNGYTFTELARYIEGLDFGLKTLTVPHYEASLEMIKGLKKKPIAIILSGSDAGYQNLPMFEFNGEYEIIREGQIPILGICCGHQMTVMAYGYTYVRAMGWLDITSLDLEAFKSISPVRIVKKDPIFQGIPNPFIAAEVHSWSVAHLPEDYEVLAVSDYVQALKSTSKFLYGEQFHAEINVPFNQAKPYLYNFLEMALAKTQKKTKK